MKKPLFIILGFCSFLSSQGFAGPSINPILPAVSQQANRAIEETKKVNPLAVCFNSAMFTHQAWRVSIEQIKGCVSNKINNLPDIPPELKAKVRDIPSMGWTEILKLKGCFADIDAMKNCSPTYQLLNHDK